MPEKLIEIPVNSIHIDNELNRGRGVVPPEDVIGLANDIKQSGLVEPVIIRKYTDAQKLENPERANYEYGLVAGYRRHMAHIVAKLETIKCLLHEDMTDDRARVMNLRENIHRKDLTYLQEARALEPYLKSDMTRTQIERELGVTTQWIQTRQYLLAMPHDIQQELSAGMVPITYVRQLYSLKTKVSIEKMYEFYRKVKEEQNKPKAQRKELVPQIRNKKALRVRQRQEMFDIQDEIQRNFGNNLATRTLAFCAGEISEEDLTSTVKEYGKIPSVDKMKVMADDIVAVFGEDSMEAKIAYFYIGLKDDWQLRLDIRDWKMAELAKKEAENG